MIELRPYQAEGLVALWDYFQAGNTGNPLIAWPTGTGKSIIPAIWIKYVMQQWPKQRFLMVTHVKELIAQNHEVLKYVWPNAPVSIYSAGLKLKNAAMPIVYGGVQSMAKHPSLFGWRDIAFVDEAHLINADDSSMYKTFFATMRLINPNLKIIGMTATPFRQGWGLITDPYVDEDGIDKRLFTDIVHDVTQLENFNKLIAEGYLSPLIPLRTREELDVSGVQIIKGEFVASQLQLAVDKQEVTYNALHELVAAGNSRRAWLIFASGIEHAEHVAETLRAKFNITCAAVHSKQKAEYNDVAISDFKKGKLRAIVNYGKLTTGFNYPEIDLIGMLRPTLSVPLWVQMLGRGTRPANGKQNCIAKGSLILTDIGLVPIEDISLEMKLWDGVEFVSHNGLVYQGYKEVVEYHGLVATMDHKVWTEKGWQTFGECIQKRIGIAITEFGGKRVQLSKNYFSGNNLQKTFLYSCNVYSLLTTISKRIYQRNEWQSWLSFLWSTTSNSSLAFETLYIGTNALPKSERCSLSGLWGTWNKIQFQNRYRNGIVDFFKSRFTQRIRDRQKRQQWSLRNWEFTLGYKNTKYEQSKIIKKHVYDITNAGRYNRFTVNGLLVSNCLVLDFAKNTIRLGPINDPCIPRRKGEGAGDVPVKLCEACGAYNHARVRFCCQCGQEFIFRNKLVAKSGKEELLKGDFPVFQDFAVTYPIYSKHVKEGKPPSLKVTYHCGLQAFTEYQFPESTHPLQKKKFKDWWKSRHMIDPPISVDACLQYTGSLRVPKKINVWMNKTYKDKSNRNRTSPEIMKVEW